MPGRSGWETVTVDDSRHYVDVFRVSTHPRRDGPSRSPMAPPTVLASPYFRGRVGRLSVPEDEGRRAERTFNFLLYSDSGRGHEVVPVL